MVKQNYLIILKIINIILVINIGLLVIGLGWLGFETWRVKKTSALKKVIEASLEPSANPFLTMSLEEKVGSLFIVGFEGEKLDEETKDFLQRHYFKNFLLLERNINNEEQLKNLTTSLSQICQYRVLSPSVVNTRCLQPLIAVDQEGGVVDRIRFPTSPRLHGTGGNIDHTSQAEISSVDQAYQLAYKRGEILNGLGINMNLAPVLDIAWDSSSYIARTGRAFPDRNLNPVPGTGEAGAMIKGYQESGVIGVVKHYPFGLGRTRVDPHQTLAVIDINREELEQDLYPFKKLIEAQEVKAVMVTHLKYPKIDNLPTSLSAIWINDLLKQELGFKGVVVTDDLTMKAITNNYSIAEAGKLAFLAGADLIMVSGKPEDQEQAYKLVLEAVRNGEIPLTRIEESLTRIKNLHKFNF